MLVDKFEEQGHDTRINLINSGGLRGDKLGRSQSILNILLNGGSSELVEVDGDEGGGGMDSHSCCDRTFMSLRSIFWC